jgi:DNA-binding transcriptional LysR family regulator
VELRHLEHFLAVAEEQSFTRAASRIHLVQSALSVSIRSLETELGTRLFDRTTHRVALTDTGRALLTEARRTLAAAEAARDAVAAVKGGLRGTLRLGIMHSLTLIDMAAIITRYRQQAPEVQLLPTAAHGGSAELAEQVADGRLDLAFAALPTGYPAALTVRPLASESMMLACPPEHRLAKRGTIALADLAGERFIDFPLGWGTRTSADRLFAEHGLTRDITIEVADIPVVAELVRAGLGFAFISPSMLAGSNKPILRRVHPTPEFTVSLITPADRAPTAAAQALIKLVTG